MTFLKVLKKIGSRPHVGDEEQDRLLGILHSITIAMTTGLVFLLVQRIWTGRTALVLPIAAVFFILLWSIALTRRGLLKWSGGLTLWVLIIFFDYLAIMNDGLHDSSLLGMPGVIVCAGILLDRKPFFAVTGFILISVGLLGCLEITGIVRNNFSMYTNSTDVLDILVILGITGMAVRLLADNLKNSLARVLRSEKNLRVQTDQLIESKERYRNLFEAANDAIFIMDKERFIDCNSEALDMFGCRNRTDVVAHSPWDYSPLHQPDGRDSKEKATEIIHAAIDGVPQRFYWKHSRKDGSLLDAEVSLNRVDYGSGIIMQAIVRNITERKQAEEALRESEEKYRLLFEESLDAVFTTKPTGEFTDMNAAGIKLFGFDSKEEMLRVAQAEELFWNPDNRNKYQEWMSKQGFVKDYEVECKTKEGKKLTVLETANAVRDSQGIVVAYRGILRDITAHKQLEKQFLRAQRMDSIGTLAGGVAHDLNNVLAPIMMAVEVLQSKFSDEESKRILNTLEKSSKRGSDIVKQILAFGRGVEGDRVIIQPKHIIREIERIAMETFPKSIQFRTLVPKDLWPILADPTQIHQVLLNVCVNARDAMPKGGVLSVSAENFHVDEHYAGMNIEAKEGRYVVLTVADTGTGIPGAIMDHIFDPFFTTKEIGKGTGLGLSTALGIVRSHGGFINVNSEEGRGTSFKVYLPAQLKDQEAVKETVRPQLPQGKGELILVVDDEASIREIAKFTLEANGYQVVTANDGVEAISIFARDEGTIKLVLMDLMMPGMDGPATILALQMMKTSAKIVATSGEMSRGGTVIEAIPGVSAFLKKPYTGEMLLKTLHDVLSAG